MANKLIRSQIDKGAAFRNRIVGYFVVATLCALPIVVTDYYFNILPTKYYFYCGTLLCTAAVMLIYELACRKDYLLVRAREIRALDYGLLAYLILAAIMMRVFSQAPGADAPGDWAQMALNMAKQVLWMALPMVFSLAYFGVTRFGTRKLWYVDLVLAAALIPCLAGMKGANYFYTVVLVGIGLALAIYGLLYKRQYLKGILSALKKELCLPDYALLAFLAVAVLSTIFSDYKYESFWGNEGRYSGLFLLLLYGLSYFLVTRFWSFKKWHVDAFLVVALFPCLFGITDFFKLDLLGFKRDMYPDQMGIFTSTIGNINTYTAYVGLVTAAATTLFATCKEWKRCLLYFAVMVVSLFAIIMGVSDNAYLALAALFGFLPLYLFRTKKGVGRYLIIVASFFSVIQGIDWISMGMKGKVLEIESAFTIVVHYSGLLYLVLALWVVVALWYGYCHYFGSKGKEVLGNWLRYLWIGLLVAIVLGICYMAYDCNVNGDASRYSALSSYLVFNDDWGTHRGCIWRLGVEDFKSFSPLKKAIGYGPDTFGILMVTRHYNEMVDRYNETFDNAHNEYLQYLVTVGIAGLAAYLTFLISTVVLTIRKAKDNPYAMAAIFAVICYGTQAVVNLSLPIATPVMWMLLAMGAAACKVKKG